MTSQIDDCQCEKDAREPQACCRRAADDERPVARREQIGEEGERDQEDDVVVVDVGGRAQNHAGGDGGCYRRP